MGLGRHFIPPCRDKTTLCVHPLVVNLNTRINIGPTPRCVFVIFIAPIKPCFGNNFGPSGMYVVHSCSHTTPRKANAVGINNGCTTDLITNRGTRRLNCTTILCLSPGRGGCLSRYNPTGFFKVHNGDCVAPRSRSVLPSVAGGDLRRLTASVNLAIRHHPIPMRRVTTFSRTTRYKATTIVTPVSRVSSLSIGGSCIVTGSNGPNPIYRGLCGGLHTVRCNSRPSACK